MAIIASSCLYNEVKLTKCGACNLLSLVRFLGDTLRTTLAHRVLIGDQIVYRLVTVHRKGLGAHT